MGGGGGGGKGVGFNRGPPDDKPSVLTIRHTAGKEKFKQVLVASNFTRYLERLSGVALFQVSLYLKAL